MPPRAKNEWAKPPNDRGKQLFQLVNDLDLVIANGRKDGSHQHPRQMLTQVDYRYNPPRESLIDYALLPVHLYSACTSVLNNFHHNDYGDANSTGVVKTGHAMTCVTFNDDLVLAHEEEHQKAQDGSDGRKRIVFTDRYELPMHKHVRESYAGISDKEVDNWRLTSFNDAMKLEEENPQEAVDAAASSFAEAVLTAARKGLQTKEVDPKKSNPRKRRPAYWNKEIQVLSRRASHARHDLVTAPFTKRACDEIRTTTG